MTKNDFVSKNETALGKLTDILIKQFRQRTGSKIQINHLSFFHIFFLNAKKEVGKADGF